MATDKWADYLISATHYNWQHTHIESLRVHPDLGHAVGDSQVWSRANVVERIVGGETFVTIHRGPDDKWRHGAVVRTFRYNGTTYLRTDDNATPADNLGNLPEF